MCSSDLASVMSGYGLVVVGHASIQSGKYLDFGSGNSRIVDGSTGYYLAFQTYNSGTATMTEALPMISSLVVGEVVPMPTLP